MGITTWWMPTHVPVLIAGMWPAKPKEPESGAKVLIHRKVGEPPLVQGFSDEKGEIRAQLPAEVIGQKVRVVIVEPGFVF